MTDASSFYDTWQNLIGTASQRVPTMMSTGSYKKLSYAGESGGSSRFSRSGGEAYYLERRAYDVCMVFKYKTRKDVKFPVDPGDNENMFSDEMAGGRVLTPGSEKENDKMRIWKQRREAIGKLIESCGLHVFQFYSRDRDQIIMKIGANADKLRNTAARMKYKLQLKPEYLSAYAEFRHDNPGRPELNFLDRRVVSQIYKVQQPDDAFPTDDAIFTTKDKVLIIHHILTSADKDCAGLQIGNLLYGEKEEAPTEVTSYLCGGFFTYICSSILACFGCGASGREEPLLISYFPMHEDRLLHELTNAPVTNWFFMKPEFVTKMHDYYGDKMSFYFLWLSFYWKWLLLLAGAGFGKQIVDVICHSPDNWSCLPFCVLVAVWATFLPHFWRRQEANYAISWGSFDSVQSLEPVRPEHHGEPRINPVTAQVEPHYPFAKRLAHYLFSFTIVILCGCLTSVVIIFLLLARHHFKTDAAGFKHVLAFQIYLAAVVEFVNYLLSLVAWKLTTWENHRTRSEHEWHQLAKVMIFKFINSFFALYYITFFKAHAPKWFGTGLQCIRDDCMLDLQAQLCVFVLFRLVVQNTVELIWPRISLLWKSWYREGTSVTAIIFGKGAFGRVELADMSGAEKQAKKATMDSFEEFDESLITHGYATLFAVAAPWVCVVTLFGVLLEIWIDKRSLTETKQRPMPVKCASNDPWSTAFMLYGIVAAFTNLFLLIFGAEHAEFAQMTMTEKLTLFLFVEKFVLLCNIFLRLLFPEIPRSVTLLQLKQANVVHRALENIKVEPSQDYSIFRENVKTEFDIFEHDHMEEDDMEEPQLQSLSAVGKHLMEVAGEAAKDEQRKVGELILAPCSTLQRGPG